MTDAARASADLLNAIEEWDRAVYKKTIARTPEREPEFTTTSFVPVHPLYTPAGSPDQAGSPPMKTLLFQQIPPSFEKAFPAVGIRPAAASGNHPTTLNIRHRAGMELA